MQNGEKETAKGYNIADVSRAWSGRRTTTDLHVQSPCRLTDASTALEQWVVTHAKHKETPIVLM